ncbi:MAG: hypothetical protein IT228_03640 [Flavobacteriales bacterium]|nr:hypothetical protein [Flavobacteriales bacterium]MCC6576413.1 hypothetical protein [Flavobacteriales bacterium]NUQ14184.1 hypothetical protein [Flavobacteriales bacterium]
MQRILVSIKLAPEGMAHIRATPELQKAEKDYVDRWKEEGLLESFYISTDRTGAILVFAGVDEGRTRELIGTLPYFPYMAKVEYLDLMKQF